MDPELNNSRTAKIDALEAATRGLNRPDRQRLKESLIDLENILHDAEYREETINHITAQWLRDEAERGKHDHKGRPSNHAGRQHPVQSTGKILPITRRPTGGIGRNLFPQRNTACQ